MMADKEALFGTHVLREVCEDKKKDLATMAYEQLKRAIIYDELQVGDMLSENSIAASMNMSRTPVREAFRRLSADGLIAILPGRGAFVKPITLSEQHDIYELRLVMECFAAQTAVYNIKAEELAQVEQVWLEMLERDKAGRLDWVDMLIQDEILHKLILTNCSNKQLGKVMESISMMNFRYMMYAAKALHRPLETIQQHLDIIELIKKRDADNLVRALKEHITNSERLILSSFANS